MRAAPRPATADAQPTHRVDHALSSPPVLPGGVRTGGLPETAVSVRPRFAAFALAFAAGVGVFYLFPEMPSPGAGLLLAGVALVLACLPNPRLARLLSALLIGVVWAMLRAGVLLWAPFPDALAREPLVIEGRIVSIPADAGFARRFLFRVERTHIERDPRRQLGRSGAAAVPRSGAPVLV